MAGKANFNSANDALINFTFRHSVTSNHVRKMMLFIFKECDRRAVSEDIYILLDGEKVKAEEVNQKK